MTLFGNLRTRSTSNAKALAAFGANPISTAVSGVTRKVRAGAPFVVYTIGYERRDGDELFDLLREVGVNYLADIRDKPISRKPDFRAVSLRARCVDTRIEYGPWPSLGSPEQLRDRLHATGDLAAFHKAFRSYAQAHLEEPIEQLARIVKKKSVALLCYERLHEECHRSTIADLLADRLQAGIEAIV